MFFRFISGFIFLLLVYPNAALSKEILVVLSGKILPYQQAAAGVHAYLAGSRVSQKAIIPYVVSDLEPKLGRLEVNRVHAVIQKRNPQVIIAIGTKALRVAKAASKLPVVYVMTPNSVAAEYANVTGITMQVAPEDVVKVIADTFPQSKNLGVIYNPANSEELIRQAVSVKSSLNIVAIPVKSSSEVPAVIFKAKGKLDSLWLIPDRTVASPQNIEAFVQFSFDNKVPLIAFAPKYLKQGATMSISANPLSMGEDAAALAVEILNGVKVNDLPPRSTHQLDIKRNLKVMKKINFNVLPGKDKP